MIVISIIQEITWNLVIVMSLRKNTKYLILLVHCKTLIHRQWLPEYQKMKMGSSKEFQWKLSSEEGNFCPKDICAIIKLKTARRVDKLLLICDLLA